jgi:uncharacterized protein YaaW (UPF0174 family)
MKERRKSPRNEIPVSFIYRVLADKEYRELMARFLEKRNRVVFYDQLSYRNDIINTKLKGVDKGVADILSDINEQLKLLARAVLIDFDILHNHVDSVVSLNSGGMLFQSKDVLETGVAIEIQLKLSSEIPCLLIVAEVLRSERIKSSEKVSTVVSFTFTEPEDKAILADFVIQRLKDDHAKKILV